MQLHIARGDDRDRPSVRRPASAVRRKDSAAIGSSVRLYGADSVVVRVKTPSEAFSMPNRPVPSVQTFSRLRYGTSAGTSVVRARRVHGAASHGGPSAAGEVTLVPLPLPIPVPLPRARAAPSAQPATRSGPLGSPAPALEPLSGPQPGRAATTTAVGTTSERARPLLIWPVRPYRRPGVRLSRIVSRSRAAAARPHHQPRRHDDRRRR